jgi:hypothetical protein
LEVLVQQCQQLDFVFAISEASAVTLLAPLNEGARARLSFRLQMNL